MGEFSHPFQTLGSAPIPGDSPAGINARYESVYESLNAELAKLESVSGEKTDWNRAEQFAVQILSDISKDFAVASYLTYALTVQQGYPGLRAGLCVISDLIDSFWDDGFPAVARLRGRKSPLEWLAEKLCTFVTATPPPASALADSVECYNLLKSIDFSLRDRMQDSAPDLAELSRALKQVKQAAEFELQKSAPVSNPVTQVAIQEHSSAEIAAPTPVARSTPDMPAVKPAAATPVPEPEPRTSAARSMPQQSGDSVVAVIAEAGELSSEADAKRLLRQVQDAQRQLAVFFANQKTSDPRRYRLSRSALWDSIDKLPPARDGKTQLPKPPLDKLKKCEELLLAQQYSEVISQAEAFAVKLPYWFDGNRFIAEALAALGGEFSAARDALIDELTQLLRRVPGIVDLQYSDGTPFASDATRFWLKSLLSVEQAEPATGNDELAEVLANASKAAATGKLPQALEMLRRDYAPANTREAYRVRLASAELILNSGKAAVAIPLLEQLIKQGEQIAAENWESDFFAHAYDLLVKAYSSSAGGNDADEERKSSAFNRLCWLDPAMASVI